MERNTALKKTGLTRRDFLLRMPVALLGMAFLGRWLPSTAAADEAMKAPKAMPARPPGTCHRWLDRNANGVCDNSESGPKRCNALTCPGNKNNLKRPDAKKNGAPKGTCALWEDPDQAGSCEISMIEKNPCMYDSCPAYRKE